MNKGLSLLLSLFLTLNVVGALASRADSLVVDLGYAQYEGIRNVATSNVNFLGVRYAKSPTGSLRWKAPQSPDPVSELQLAHSQPPLCPQAPGGNATTSPFRDVNDSRHDKRDERPSQVEDCLFLNVYVPGSQFDAVKSYDAPEGLPVVVYIHGGGFHFGGASNSGFPNVVGGYDGEDLLRHADNGVIAIVIQYRLGLFGFLAGEKVKGNGDLNVGLLDQQFALQWVQEHISKFGGDPSKVVIWGESAGGGSVLSHIVANDGQTNPPLFRGAISSSGVIPSYYPYNDVIPEILYAQVVDQANCTDSQDTLACLRTVEPGVLVAANVKIASAAFFRTFVFAPVIDGTFFTQRPTELLAAGKLNKVEKLLAVHNSFEATAFVDPNSTDISEFARNLFPTLSEDTVAEVAIMYSGPAQVYGESMFICPSYWFLETLQGSAYKGLFAVPPAFHTDDVFYYFNSSLQRPSPPKFNNTDFQKAFSRSFLTFATSEDLDPNDKLNQTILPNWPLWSSGSSEMLFNRTADFQPEVQVMNSDEGLLSRCRFWQSVANETNQ